MSESRNSASLRTVDVARRAEYSVQQIRNLERDGVLPPALRTPTGYRVYREIHMLSARAYRALAAGAGPVAARAIVRAAHLDSPATMLALLDTVHAGLATERRDLEATRAAVRHIGDEPITDVRGSDSMSVSDLADALGIRPSTLRHWDATGLVTPTRNSTRDARTYTPADVRDARIVHQLRRAGYGIPALGILMAEFRDTRRWSDVLERLAVRDAAIESRALALLAGAAELHALRSLAPARAGGGEPMITA
ncbi:MerR family transcriptional regulator [Nocardia seriolae]|uniref:MerR family transcriptional regulator n=1 Tax=Nocardia seriolae TaxID=37332 RepID=UPI001328F90F|nr:MerR family transcriptional regulator [Nocardia seriolae]MTL13749.1 MerR family transcriptional regulator [Nocardia seriolae]